MSNAMSNRSETLNAWVEFEDTHTNFTAEEYEIATHGA